VGQFAGLLGVSNPVYGRLTFGRSILWPSMLRRPMTRPRSQALEQARPSVEHSLHLSSDRSGFPRRRFRRDRRIGSGNAANGM
jgi:hypothetical protein